MQIEFDPVKNAGNRAKHGVSLTLAAELDWDAALVWVDDRFAYAEFRMIALAPTTGILYYVAFVDRASVRRIISLRRANRREVKHYVESIQASCRCNAYRSRRPHHYVGGQERSGRTPVDATAVEGDGSIANASGSTEIRQSEAARLRPL